MTLNGWIQIAIFAALVLVLVRPVGGFMTRLFNGERTFMHVVLSPLERGTYALCGVDPNKEQGWVGYATGMLLFKIACFIILYAMMRLQGFLPFNPAGQSAVSPDLSLNTAISFITNTNWQNYGGESTMSYLVQMAGLAVQNFASAAAGVVIAVALIRGFARRSTSTIGNFWADMTRATLYLLLPACIILTLFYVWQGMPQTLGGYVDAVTLEGGKQSIALGPVASQVAIKMLGTNGGGFFNANAAHPFENPTGFTNLIQMVTIFVIGAGLTNTFGRMVRDERQGWALLAAMGVLWFVGTAVLYWAESHGTRS